MYKYLKKNKIVLLIICSFLAFSVVGCGRDSRDNDKIRVVCTQFSQYDWIRNIIGESESIELELLVSNGTDMHSYQPSASDIITIKSADVFIYVGGESDGWVKDVLKQNDNSDMIEVNMMNILNESYLGESIIQEVETEESEPLSFSNDDIISEGNVEKENENDEHIWLSINNAEMFCLKFAEVLSDIDSDSKELYNRNCMNYIEQLKQLDTQYSGLASVGSEAVVVIADRFPFAYLFRDYQVKCFAAFEGCSSETEASFDTIIKLGEKLDEYELGYVYIVDNSTHELAETVIDNSKNANREILVLNSLQSVTKKDIDNGMNYLDVMKSNYEVLEKGINR